EVDRPVRQTPALGGCGGGAMISLGPTGGFAMANEAQREYWNSAPGEKWVANQARLDRQMQEVTAALWRRAAPAAGERALDVGCGAGETTLAAARRVAPAGAVLGVDISEPLLELARERVRAANVANVELLAADAQTHP